MKWFVIILFIGMGNCFLLDSGNSSVPVKAAFVTVSEYFDGQSRTRDELDKMKLDILNNREEQKRTLNLLTSQLQAKLDAFEQQITTKTSLDSNQAALLTTLQQEIASLRNDSDIWKQMYQSLEENYKKLESESKAIKQTNQNNVLKYQTLEHSYTNVQQEVNILKAENQFLKNDSTDLHEKLDNLMRLKSIDQLQTINKLQHETQNLDLKVKSLESTEQARGQDLLALYNKVNTLETKETSTKETLSGKLNSIEQTMNKNLSSLKQNMTITLQVVKMKQDRQLETLENKTKIEFERVMESNNASIAHLEVKIHNELKPVIFTACHLNNEFISTGLFNFSTIKTSVGVPDLSGYQSTGKFTCQDPGYYYVMTIIESSENYAEIQIMVNSTEQHRQYVTGYANGYWTPGTAAITLNLKTYDQVWINLVSGRKYIYRSCLNIFKIN